MPLPLSLPLLPELSPLNAQNGQRYTRAHKHTHTHAGTVNDVRMRVHMHPPTTHMNTYAHVIFICICVQACVMCR